MTSTRLPGKVLASLAGRPLLAQQIARLRRSRTLDAIVVATTTNAADDPIAALCTAEGLSLFRGDEHDVLGRYAGAAEAHGARVVVRITADCPLLDPLVVDRVVGALREGSCDYASNTLRRTYPRGLDVEAFHVDVLTRMARLATSTMAREHVTWFLHHDRPDLFVRREVVDSEDHSDLRWTVDTAADLAHVRRIYEAARLPERWLDYRELLSLVRGFSD